jgi:hypothetical protein
VDFNRALLDEADKRAEGVVSHETESLVRARFTEQFAK